MGLVLLDFWDLGFGGSVSDGGAILEAVEGAKRFGVGCMCYGLFTGMRLEIERSPEVQ